MPELTSLARLALLPAALALAGADADAAWGAEGEEAPPQPGISDNSFFIEEAYNQEAGVVQHIQTALWGFDREAGERTRSFGYSFTQEWPLGGVAHQISYTLPYERLGGDQPNASGVGDMFLNYRYQMWTETGRRPAFAPRLSLIFQTGEMVDDVDTGPLSYQVNLPFSKKLGDRFYVHLNAGATATRSARRDLVVGGRPARGHLLDSNLGVSGILLVRPDFNLLIEILTGAQESIDEAGARLQFTRSLISPGVRYAINTRVGAQWVLGAALPISASRAGDDVGILLYLSIEHPFKLP